MGVLIALLIALGGRPRPLPSPRTDVHGVRFLKVTAVLQLAAAYALA
jgi:hypothetical protein